MSASDLHAYSQAYSCVCVWYYCVYVCVYMYTNMYTHNNVWKIYLLTYVINLSTIALSVDSVSTALNVLTHAFIGVAWLIQ